MNRAASVPAGWLASGAWALAIALGAQLRVPMTPVPMTLQTLALFLCAGLCGPRRALVAAGVYLVAVLLGAPILAGFAAAPGRSFFALRSAGYVLGFLPAALLAATWLSKGRTAGRFPSDFLVILVGHGVVLLCGSIWLGSSLSARSALLAQVPLLGAAVLKSAAVAGLLRLSRKRSLEKKISLRFENLSGLR